MKDTLTQTVTEVPMGFLMERDCGDELTMPIIIKRSRKCRGINVFKLMKFAVFFLHHAEWTGCTVNECFCCLHFINLDVVF